MKTQKTTYNFTATLSLFPTQNGGRKKPVYDHYRPSFSFNTVNHFSGEVSFPNLKELQPGDTTTAIVKLLSSRHIPQKLKSGASLTILEGDKVVGTGVITDILNEQTITVAH